MCPQGRSPRSWQQARRARSRRLAGQSRSRRSGRSLPYNELGAIVEVGPTELHDTLAAVVGLEPLTEARDLLRQKRLELQRNTEEGLALGDELLPALEDLDDNRGRECARALAEDPMDLDALELVLSGAIDESAMARLDLLTRVALLEVPEQKEVEAAIAALEQASGAVRQIANTDAGRARARAEILQRALDLHTAHSDQACPVCGVGSLDVSWHERAAAHVAQLTEEAEEAIAAQRAFETAMRNARGLIAPPPVLLSQMSGVGIDADALLVAWAEWSDLNGDTGAQALGAHLALRYKPLATAVEQARTAAVSETNRLEDAWRPLAAQLREAMPLIRAAERALRLIPSLQAGQSWLDTITAEIKEERFRPIANEAAAIWETLSQKSSVSLDEIALEGRDNRRRVDLNVTIDGVPGAALGVMSQGEIHSLALSLFLPRVMMADTPFRFVIIDDPVQAMDPAKVDGLARVLHRVAGSRQVVAFTHDNRLPEALRRLQLPTEVIEVTRRENSEVDTRRILHPAEQFLDDARAVVRTAHLPPRVAERVVPGFCRYAIEAAAVDVVRRRRIGRGEAHAAVDAELDGATTLLMKLALTLFDDAGRAGDVMLSVQNRWGVDAADAVGMANRGSHAGIDQSRLSELVDGVSRVVALVRDLT